MADTVNRQQTGGDDPDETENEVVVIGTRIPNATGTGGGGSSGAIIVNIGDINGAAIGLVEFLRALVTNVTDFDVDPSFTPKQREIIVKAIRGLADHPDFAAKMTELLTKGADTNIVADVTGRHTGGDHARTEGKNDDGTVDRGESMTIYINMDYGGAPTTNPSLPMPSSTNWFTHSAIPHLTHCSTRPDQLMIAVRRAISSRGTTSSRPQEVLRRRPASSAFQKVVVV